VLLGCGERLRAQAPGDTARPKQKDLIDLFYQVTHWKSKFENRDLRKINFSLVPVPSGLVGGDEFVVSSINGAFYLGSPDNTNLSTVYFIPYTNFVSRIGFIITPNVWLSGNQWDLTGDFRIIGNNLNTYGIGSSSTTLHEEQIDHGYIRAYASANRRIRGSLYAGLGYDVDDYYNVTEHWAHAFPSDFQLYGIGTGKRTTSSGVTFDLLFDNRKNSINPSRGTYSTLVFRFNPEGLGSTNAWTSLYFDNRHYFSFSSTHHEILGLRAFYWGSYGAVPYLNLPGTALEPGARSGRGYSLARYIGKQMLYGEAEYRFDLSPDGFWGGVCFANLESLAERTTNRFAYLLPAAGTGLRLKFNKKSGSNVTLDVAAGKNSFNWYISLGEFF
jgi:outer membrane protein assembly factor BamA